MNILVVGAKGYIGASVLGKAREVAASKGTSSSDSPCMLRLQLDAPDDVSYNAMAQTHVVFLTAAISAPNICAREHDRAWAMTSASRSAPVGAPIWS